MPEINLPRGFQTAGISCGIKTASQHRDLAMFVSQSPAVACGVFTQNRVCGAPVHVSRSRVPTDQCRAVVINSGNANACTGQVGLEHAQQMTDTLADVLGCDSAQVLVCSTGIIGQELPIDQIRSGIPICYEALGSQPENLQHAAQAMMTTDTFHKTASRQLEIDGCAIRVTGAAKGAAMIAPNMATMLAVIMTDAGLENTTADAMLRQAVQRSFNCISVDGHTSTSDSVLLLANAAAGTTVRDADGLAELQRAFDEVAIDLAQAIVRDGEGAEHFVTIDVRGLGGFADAYRIAKTVAESPLVKTAIAGADPNWGRIVSAIGYSGVEVEEHEITLRINQTLIYRQGAPVQYDAGLISQQMRESRDVHIDLEFQHGTHDARFWTTDLTAEYVRLNSEYTT